MTRRILYGFAFTLLVGCSGNPSVPELGDPYFYLVLQPGGVWSSVEPGAHFAIALTIVTPAEIRCRRVQRLEMHRVADGVPFAWQAGSCEVAFGPSIPSDACCVLPASSPSPPALGASDLVHGERYRLTVETEGVQVLGTTRIPDQVRPRLVINGPQRLVVWQNVDGAGGYEIDIGTDPVRQQDTTFSLPPEGNGRIAIRALDPNLWTFLTNPRAVRAGIDTGLGLFGAVSADASLAY